MTDKKQRCSQKIWRDGFFMANCSRAGVVLRMSRYYCRQHDPVEIQRRKDARQAKWDQRYEDARLAADAADNALRADGVMAFASTLGSTKASRRAWIAHARRFMQSKGWVALILVALTLSLAMPARASEGVIIPPTLVMPPTATARSVKDQWPRGAHVGSIWAAYISRVAECVTQEIGYAVAGAYGENKSGRLSSCYMSFYLTGFAHTMSRKMFEADADVTMATGGTLPGAQGTIKNVLLIRKIQAIKRGRP